MVQVDPDMESRFISVHLMNKKEEFKKDLRCMRMRNETVLTMLLDKYYNQRDCSNHVPSSNAVIDRTPLQHFLKKFALACFYPMLASKGYNNKISSFFFINDRCFKKTLDMLKPTDAQRKTMYQLRRELIELRLDNEAAEKPDLPRPTSIAFIPCQCCKVQPDDYYFKSGLTKKGNCWKCNPSDKFVSDSDELSGLEDEEILEMQRRKKNVGNKTCRPALNPKKVDWTLLDYNCIY